MGFKLEDIKFEGYVSKQEIKGSYDFNDKKYLSSDRTFGSWFCDCHDVCMEDIPCRRDTFNDCDDDTSGVMDRCKCEEDNDCSRDCVCGSDWD